MIGSALERGSLIYVYEEGGRCSRRPRGQDPSDGLFGFTGSTVSVWFGSIIYTYDETGMTLFSKAA